MALLTSTQPSGSTRRVLGPRRLPAIGVAISWMLLVLLRGPAGAAEPASETKLKAALIFKFAVLAEWPDTAFSGTNTPVIIGIASQPPLEEALKAFSSGKKIGDRPVVVRPQRDPADVAKVHVLVVSDLPKVQMDELIGRSAGHPVLTIGDTEETVEAGGMVRLRRAGGKLTFDVNVRALRRVEPTGLRLNPQVLKLGTLVEGGAPP